MRTVVRTVFLLLRNWRTVARHWDAAILALDACDVEQWRTEMNAARVAIGKQPA
jgi:hypothetical protein